MISNNILMICGVALIIWGGASVLLDKIKARREYNFMTELEKKRKAWG